jgi:tetratricopeptide (TPR) repeat protein
MKMCWFKSSHAHSQRRIVTGQNLVSGYVISRLEKIDVSMDLNEKGEKDGVQKKEEKKKRKKTDMELVYEGEDLWRKGQTEGALSSFIRAAKANPRNGIALYGWGSLLPDTDLNGKITAYQKALLADKPSIDQMTGRRLAVTHDLATFLNKSKRYTEAEALFKEAKDMADKTNPNFYYAYYNYAQFLENSMEFGLEAAHLYRLTAKSRKNDYWRFYGDLLLPRVYESAEDMQFWRKRFADNLLILLKDNIVFTPGEPNQLLGCPQYYLAYHGLNDVALISQVGDIWRRAMPAADSKAAFLSTYRAPVLKAGQKIKVGFVSFYLRQHSVIKMCAGLIKYLDKTKFDITLFQTGHTDKYTEKLLDFGAQLVHMPSWELKKLISALDDAKMDILIFTDIGMDPFSYSLAIGRHAPTQLAMHGHAATTGLSSIDYYISYEGFSEPKVHEHFSEQVVGVLIYISSLVLFMSMKFFSLYFLICSISSFAVDLFYCSFKIIIKTTNTSPPTGPLNLIIRPSGGVAWRHAFDSLVRHRDPTFRIGPLHFGGKKQFQAPIWLAPR